MKGFVGELAVIIGGSRNGNGAGADKRLSPRLIRDAKMLPQPSPDSGKSKLRKGGKGHLTSHKSKEVKPDQVIPMGASDFRKF
jgi:hypothetical protein